MDLEFGHRGAGDDFSKVLGAVVRSFFQVFRLRGLWAPRAACRGDWRGTRGIGQNSVEKAGDATAGAMLFLFSAWQRLRGPRGTFGQSRFREPELTRADPVMLGPDMRPTSTPRRMLT